MKNKFFIAALGMSFLCRTALAEVTPKIQFDQMVYDFGTTARVETVTGTFKFKNTGDGVLKLAAPKPSCGCTVASFKSDTLAPGESGELTFTLNLGRTKAQLEKHIAVSSNDPLSPEVSLTIKANYTPLYDLNPMLLAPNLAFGVNDTDQVATITRTDGKPLGMLKLDASKPWITAKVETNPTNEATARIRISIHRDGPPRRFNEFVHIYAPGQSNAPVSSISLSGQVMGEVSLSPEALYWSVPNTTIAAAERPEAETLRRMTIRSDDGKALELKNPQSSIKGIKVELVPKESGKVYELVARLDEVPASTISGNVSFETSVAAQSRIEVPVIVNVFKP